MTLKELKDWVSSIPEEFSEYEVFTGGEMIQEDTYLYRVENPIITCLVDKENKAVVLLSEHTKET